MTQIFSYAYDSHAYHPAAPVIEIGLAQSSTSPNKINITALVDSGADATMLPIALLKQVKARFVQTRQMQGVTGHHLVVDTYMVAIHVGGQILPGLQVVGMRQENESIIGRDVLNQLQIVLDGLALVTELHPYS